MDKEIGYAYISPHNIIVGIELKKQNMFLPLFVVNAGIFLGEIGVTTDFVPAGVIEALGRVATVTAYGR